MRDGMLIGICCSGAAGDMRARESGLAKFQLLDKGIMSGICSPDMDIRERREGDLLGEESLSGIHSPDKEVRWERESMRVPLVISAPAGESDACSMPDEEWRYIRELIKVRDLLHVE
jgi:hypothetical protein